MMARMGVYFEEEAQREYPEFETRRGEWSWEDYLPPMGSGLAGVGGGSQLPGSRGLKKPLTAKDGEVAREGRVKKNVMTRFIATSCDPYFELSPSIHQKTNPFATACEAAMCSSSPKFGKPETNADGS